MQFNSSNSYNLLLFLAISILSSCGGYKFQKTATAQSPLSTIARVRENNIIPESQVIVMKEFPIDRKYLIIGKCYGSSYRGAWTNLDGSYSAFKLLRKCACANGGNAIVITDKEQVINPYEYIRTQNQGTPITFLVEVYKV